MAKFFQYVIIWLQHFVTRYGFNLVILIAVGIACYFSYLKGDITLLKWLMLTLFASITVISFMSFLRLLEKHQLGVQRSAPTIDGSISGWRLTNSLTLLLVTCVFMAATLIVYLNKPTNPDAKLQSRQVNEDSNISVSRNPPDTTRPQVTIQ